MDARNAQIDQQETDLEQSQVSIEQWWEDITWRANALNLQADSWPSVKQLVDDLNTIGEDPSFAMQAQREQIIANMRTEAEQLNDGLTDLKCKILQTIQIECDMSAQPDYGWNLMSAHCDDTNTSYYGDATGDGCSWYDSYPSTCGSYDTWEFYANSMCCSCGGGSCHDSNGSAADWGGDGCDWYVGNEEYCGLYNDSDFIAGDMCCACSTDYALNLQSSACYDTNFGIGDTTGDGCDWYAANDGHCGGHDTWEFSSNSMCCSCGGGIDAQAPHCDDNNTSWYGDATGDGCEWYDSYPSTCGSYDTYEFYANSMCCSCGGGVCDDSNGSAADWGGDGCDWYVGNESWCGSFDDDDFIASTMCCACQTDYAQNLSSSGCSDLDWFSTDVGGDDCEWYTWNWEQCGWWDTDNFQANDLCCACNGGWLAALNLLHCDDTNTSWYGDATGDGCEWYDSYPSTCGSYDTYEFYANSMCCSCGGGVCDDSWANSDAGGDSCSWYYGMEAYCGLWDDSDFTASTDCCACKTDYAMNLEAQSCYDTNFGIGDTTGDGCDWYAANDGHCGGHDTWEFSSNSMCCSCGGGISPTPTHCDDTNTSWYGDSTGDGCEWYDSYPSTCGSYDTYEFYANSMCCSCGGGSCHDSNGSGADWGGDGCDWYVGMEAYCGLYDDSDFIANEMCCACKTDYAMNLQAQSCYDTNFGLGDTTGDGCDWYAANDGHCGGHDTWEFSSNSMCCSCGGGISPTPTHCDDTNTSWYGDSTGDGCEWYDSYPSTCGSYDTYEFYANSMCCSCGGGSCHDSNGSAVDTAGDGCDSYVGNEFWCGWFDNADFIAADMCCACDSSSSVQLLTSNSCDDTNTSWYGDATGDGCEWYDSYPSTCGQYDTYEFDANNMCCSCGGGTN